ncbi:MAG TPA: hypothetical protein VFQ87_00730 [Bradyrhizobium sp.]|nr:hypothetical protein [Bradyrhizobium sp.]
MTKRIHVAVALALLSTVPSTRALAQFSEPAAFASEHPDRDVLNGGELTPEARAKAGLQNAWGAVRGTDSVSPHGARDRPRRHR